MFLAFTPYNLREGGASGKVTVAASETIDKQYLQNELRVISDTYHEMHRGTLIATAGGLFVVVLLIIFYTLKF